MPNLDESLSNADWTKRTWDLPDTVEGLLGVLVRDGSGETPEEAAARFLTLPAARAMPDGLRAQLEGMQASSRFRTFRSRGVSVTVPFHAGPGPHPGTGSPQQAHGGGGGGAGFRFVSRMAPRSRDQVENGMARVQSRFPALTAGVELEVGPKHYADTHPRSMAWVKDGQGTTVSLSPRHIDSPDTAAKLSEESSRSGYLVKVPDTAHGYDRYTVHEMGHIAEFRLGGKRIRRDVDAAFLRDHGMTLTDLIADGKSGSPSPLAMEAYWEFSQYGTSTVHEFIAEAFTDGILNENPSKFSQTVMGVIESVYDEKLGGDL